MDLVCNTFGILDRSAQADYADRPAYGFPDGSVTFREMRDRALDVAGGLAAQGVRPGDKVAVMMGNRREWFEVFFGLAALGAVCVPVNVLLAGPEIAHVCRDSGAQHLIVDDIAGRAAAQVGHRFDTVITVGDVEPLQGSRTCRYEDLTHGHHLPESHVGPALDDPFILYYGSGTTGLPKAAVHTHNGVMWNAASQIIGLSLTSDVRYDVVPSLSWAAGFHNLTLSLTWIGGYSQVRPSGGLTVDALVDGIERDRTTHIMLVPSLLRTLVTRPDLTKRLSESSLKWIVTGAEPVPREVVESVAAAMPGVDVCQGYGLSEFPSVVTVLQTNETKDHAGSAGRTLPFTTIAVRQGDGEIRPTGRGELLIRSPATMVGYYERPEQSAVALRDGWLNTGDLVDIDDAGFMTIVGRTKDLIISGGLNVYPKEVEDVIARVPGVREVAVVGVPHPRFGESPVAIVVCDQPFDTSVIEKVCAEQMASYKRPKKILVRSEPLPRNANAKLLKRELRPWAADLLSAADSME